MGKAKAAAAAVAIRHQEHSEQVPDLIEQSAPVTHAELAGLVAIVEKLTALVAAPAAPRETPWITLKQASEISGLGVGFLERLVREKMLRGAKGGKYGAWVVRRADVEALEL